MNPARRLAPIERNDAERALVVEVDTHVVHELPVVDKTAVVVRLELPDGSDPPPPPPDASVLYAGPDGDMRVGVVAYRQEGLVMIQSAPRLDPNRH